MSKELEKQAIGIVAQLFDLAGVSVAKRQQINDTAYDYMYAQLKLNKTNKMDITQQIPTLTQGTNTIDIPFNNYTIVGEIKLTDTREYNSPGHDSCDGIGELRSGEITIEFEIEVLDKDGANIEFELDERYIYELYED